jgi:hypothetical protein
MFFLFGYIVLIIDFHFLFIFFAATAVLFFATGLPVPAVARQSPTNA